jgi:hypothetical protein
MRFLFLLTIFWNIFSPAAPGFAINPQTKECGWLGGEDEYGQYTMFPPWEKHYGALIQNGDKSCKLDQAHDVETCCKMVGYTYVPGDMGSKHGVMLFPLMMQVGPFLLLGWIIFMAIRNMKKSHPLDTEK